MIIAAWYFTDETEGIMGPFISRDDAERAGELYGEWLATGHLTAEHEAERNALCERANDLMESMGIFVDNSTFLSDRKMN